MIEQILVIGIVGAGIVIVDWKRLRRASRREKAAWFCMLGIFLYLGVDWLVEAPLPQATAFLDWAFGPVARAIESWFAPEA